MTGILDRLERGGWVDRGRDPSDRRGVLIQAAAAAARKSCASTWSTRA